VRRGLLLTTAILSGFVSAGASAQVVAAAQDLTRLSIEELANLEITSVTRRPQPLSQAAAPIYVITNDDIRRSGATRLAEALRLAPNLHVARLDAGNYAITARGFNHNTGTANKLQVMVDGRVIYNPLFSGVFWDEPDVPVADIDRIEVISGPAGALWGSNAVNGVINIVTRNSRDTQGALVDVSGGSLDQTAVLRYGGRISDSSTFRVYGMGSRHGTLQTASGADVGDAWDKLRGGFRADWSAGANSWTLQGDIYEAVTEDQPGALKNGAISGSHVLSRWNRQFDSGSMLQAQLYYSKKRRDATSGITAMFDAYDIDAQYSFTAGSAHSVVLGGGYRVMQDEFIAGPGTVFLDPEKRQLRLANGFIQDQISLWTNLNVTFGLKAEHNSYTGMEYMPDARIAWTLSDASLLWASVSRAVRSPARFDRDLFNPGIFAGGPNFDSEKLIAYEAGYRGQPGVSTTVSVSGFYNVYDELRSVEASTPVIFPLVVRNGMEGETFGVEFWATHAIASWWRVSAGVAWLHKDLRLKPGSTDIFGVQFAGNDPTYQASLRSNMELSDNLELDISLRAVDDLPSPRIPGYLEADLRLGWRITESLELSLLGANLLHDRHTEFANPAVPTKYIPRSITAAARWRF
jgi:iron complex outermembrane recepter protein